MTVKTTMLSIILSALLCAPATAADTKQIDANGTSLSYVEAGQGVPVVFVHGVLGDYRTWRGEMDDFAGQYHVIAYSLRYHYPNTWTDGEYSYQLHTADLVSLLQALNLGPVHLVGHSYGGTVAAFAAREHPELVRSLILAEAGIGSWIANKDEAKPLLAEGGKVSKTAQELVQKGELDQAAITLMDYFNTGGGGFKGLPAVFQAGMLQNTSTLKPLFVSPVPPPFACDDAGKITAPTLLVEGELTLKVRHLLDDELQRCLPNVDRVLISGAAHPLEMVNPKDFNVAVLQFLMKH
jgi:pimeloyl-ACP methyl ester carboxylesterase